MLILQDQIGNRIELPRAPQRIVSLVPSITEYVCDLNARDRVVAVTKFCVHPEALMEEKAVIGGTKNVNVAKVKALYPDLILASKEENVREQVEELSRFCPVYTSDVQDLTTSFRMMEDVARLLDRIPEWQAIEKGIKLALKQISPRAPGARVAYLIWKKPFMVAGGDTFISAMLEACGFENGFADWNRYPAVSLEKIAGQECTHIFLSSEPYPFKEADRQEIEQLTSLPTLLVDGEAFSWYGSRMGYGLRYGKELPISKF